MKESENIDKYFDLAKELKRRKKNEEHEGDCDTIFKWRTWNGLRKLWKRL